MRGGCNVEVFDAEWWVRHGCAQSSENLGSVWWRWIISSPELDRLFLVSNDYVLQVEGRVGEVGVPDNTTFFRQLVDPVPDRQHDERHLHGRLAHGDLRRRDRRRSIEGMLLRRPGYGRRARSFLPNHRHPEPRVC